MKPCTKAGLKAVGKVIGVIFGGILLFCSLEKLMYSFGFIRIMGAVLIVLVVSTLCMVFAVAYICGRDKCRKGAK